jgi:hypothetical protein
MATTLDIANAANIAYNAGVADAENGYVMPEGYKLDTQFNGTGVLRDPKTGFEAIALKNAAGDVILSFTGTQPSLQDDYTDLNAGTTQWQGNSEKILGYLNGLKEGTTVDLTGHSLGGALAQFALYDSQEKNSYTKENLKISLTTFDALGSKWGLEKMYGDKYDPSRVAGIDAKNLADKNDLVPRFGGDHFGDVILIGDGGQLFTQAHPMKHMLEQLQKHGDTGTIMADSEYLPIQHAQQLLSGFANIQNDSEYDETEALFRLMAATRDFSQGFPNSIQG